MNDRFRSTTERQAIEAEASRLVVQLDLTDDEQLKADAYRWIQADPYHAVAFAQAKAVWNEAPRIRTATGSQGEAEDRLAPDEDTNDAIAAPSYSRRGVIAGAAMAAAAIGAVGIGVRQWTDGRHITGRGQRITTTLNDGSAISLNTDTEIDVSMGRYSRSVNLIRGEALFDVAREEDRPFVIDVGGARIQVLGTRFNVRRKSDVIELSVTEGLVSASSDGQGTVKVPAGSTALIRSGMATSVISDTALIRQRTAWTSGFMEFNEEPLEDVVREFNRYRDKPIVIGDPRIASVIIAGRFGVNESDQFLEALTVSFGVKVQNDASGSVMLFKASDTE